MSLLLPERVKTAQLPQREELVYEHRFAYRSTTHCVRRYIQLYELMAYPRSIPLGKHKTHGGKTDSRGRWQKIQGELAILFTVFPKSQTDEWWLLILNQATNMMPDDRRKKLEENTGRSWSTYRFERYSTRAFRDLGYRLQDAGLIPAEEADKEDWDNAA